MELDLVGMEWMLTGIMWVLGGSAGGPERRFPIVFTRFRALWGNGPVLGGINRRDKIIPCRILPAIKWSLGGSAGGPER